MKSYMLIGCLVFALCGAGSVRAEGVTVIRAGFNFMVQNGMTPMQAIQSATVAGADLLGISDKVGSLARGKFADVIAVRGDPLTNVRLLEDVGFVMKQGASS